jgi:hypothetical protein
MQGTNVAAQHMKKRYSIMHTTRRPCSTHVQHAIAVINDMRIGEAAVTGAGSSLQGKLSHSILQHWRRVSQELACGLQA